MKEFGSKAEISTHDDCAFKKEAIMGYEIAITKSWKALKAVSHQSQHSVRFLQDEYNVDVDAKSVLSLSCNVCAKTPVTILVLHYLVKQLQGLPKPRAEWISFQQLEGGQGYYASFRQRTLKPILRKYKSQPQALFALEDRFKAKRAAFADAAVVINVFDGVPFLIELWRGDEEFGPEVNMLFDKSITEIFCTEDIVVLSEFVAHQI